MGAGVLRERAPDADAGIGSPAAGAAATTGIAGSGGTGLSPADPEKVDDEAHDQQRQTQ